jgi:hypothetical protein
MEQENDPFKVSKGMFDNFAMMIPTWPFISFKERKIAKRKKVLCFLIGHRWGFAGVTSVGPGWPMKCKRCRKMKWFHKYPLRMRIAKWIDKALDKIWTPLCKIGIHRFKSHYGFQEYSFGPGPSTPTKRYEVLKCSCCKKIKTVNL